MSDTPRTHLQDRLLSMVHAFHDDQRKYAVRLLANDVADLERELNAANERIRRLEEALQRIANQDYRGNRSTESQVAFEALKEAKP